MTVQSYKMGPGTLKFDTGLATAASTQVVSCEIEPSEKVDQDDDIDVLTGEVLVGDETITFEWTVKATIVQDITSGSFVAWSWANAGQTKQFEFIPNTVGARKVTGSIVVVPIKIGGAAKTRPQSDLTWRMPRGTAPALGAVA